MAILKRSLIVMPLVIVGCTTVGPMSFNTSDVKAGQPTVFHHASELRRDCSVLSIPEIRVVSPPAHGKVSVYRARFYPIGFDARNPRYHCRTKLAEGVEAKYTPDPGFTGDDSVTIRIDFHYGNGEVRKDHSETVKTVMKVR